MPSDMRDRIAMYVNSITTSSGDLYLDRAKAAIHLVATSAQFSAEK